MQNYSLYYTFLGGKKMKVEDKHKRYLQKRISESDIKIQKTIFLLIIEHSLYKKDTDLGEIYKGKYPYGIKVSNSEQEMDLKDLPDELLVVIFKFIRQMRKVNAAKREEKL